MRFDRSDGWDEQVLFDYSMRHLTAAEILFCHQDINGYVNSVYSAGYLCHLGIELLLKGWCLHENNYFESEHELQKIIKKLNGKLKIENDLQVYVQNIEQFNEYRYPQDLSNAQLTQGDDDANIAGEIGDHDWIGTIKLLKNIIDQMPEELTKVVNPIFKKFDNALTEKKYLKNDHLYRLVLDI